MLFDVPLPLLSQNHMRIHTANLAVEDLNECHLDPRKIQYILAQFYQFIWLES